MFCHVARVNVLGLHGNGFLHLSFQPMKPLKAAATTSQPVLTSQQIETIFFKVPELYEIHKEFYDGLFPRVQQWSHQQRVGDLFQKLVSWLQSPELLLPLILLTCAATASSGDFAWTKGMETCPWSEWQVSSFASLWKKWLLLITDSKKLRY